MDTEGVKVRKTDRRTKYTTQAIMDAYLTLIKEKPHNKIKITELCELAEINRCTFYLHFEDVDAVEEAIKASLVDKLKAYVKGQAANPSKRLQISNLFAQQLQNDNAYVTMAKQDLSKLSFQYDFYTRFRQDMDQSLPAGHNLTENQLNILYRFITGGISAVVQDWIVNPPEDIVAENQMLDRLVQLAMTICSDTK